MKRMLILVAVLLAAGWGPASAAPRWDYKQCRELTSAISEMKRKYEWAFETYDTYRSSFIKEATTFANMPKDFPFYVQSLSVFADYIQVQTGLYEAFCKD